MILCAALYLRNKANPGPMTDIILPCHRHNNGYETLRLLNKDYKDYLIVQGFLTSDGTFVNRKEIF